MVLLPAGDHPLIANVLVFGRNDDSISQADTCRVRGRRRKRIKFT